MSHVMEHVKSTISLAMYTLTMPANTITLYVFLTNHTHTCTTNSIFSFLSSTSLYEDIDDLILDDLFKDTDLLSTTTPTMEEIHINPHQPNEEQPSLNHPISLIEAGKHHLRALTDLKIPIIHPRPNLTQQPKVEMSEHFGIRSVRTV